MKVKVTNPRGDDVQELAHYIWCALLDERHEPDDGTDCPHVGIDNMALAIGRLCDALHTAGVLDADQIRTIVHADDDFEEIKA